MKALCDRHCGTLWHHPPQVGAFMRFFHVACAHLIGPFFRVAVPPPAGLEWHAVICICTIQVQTARLFPPQVLFDSQVQTCDQRFGHELCRPSYIYGAFNSRHFLFIRMSIFFPAMTDSFSGPWVWCLTERNLSGCNLFPLDVFVLSLKWNCQLGDRIWTWRLSF